MIVSEIILVQGYVRAYNSNFPTEVILDLALFDSIWSIVLDNLEKLYVATLDCMPHSKHR